MSVRRNLISYTKEIAETSQSNISASSYYDRKYKVWRYININMKFDVFIKGKYQEKIFN